MDTVDSRGGARTSRPHTGEFDSSSVTDDTAPDAGSSHRRFALFCGLVFVAVLAFAAYAPTLSVNFLLDDYMHPIYIHPALHGNLQPLLNAMFHGWPSDADGLTCYRPGTTLSLVIDFLLYGTNAAGYHLSNILVFCVTCVLVGVLALQLANCYSIRRPIFAAVASAALFACYPLHVESVAWIIGRVDVLCAVFYVASLCAFVGFLQRPSRGRWVACLLACVAALSCKEMAVTLPLVASLFALLLPHSSVAVAASERIAACFASTHCCSAGDTSSISGLKPAGTMQRWSLVATLWGALVAFAVVRTVSIGVLVGGYGDVDKHVLRTAWRNFTDASSWRKVIYGVTDEYTVPAFLWYTAVAGAVATAFGALANVLNNRRLLSLYLALAGWALLAILPTFQIFHIFPNLVGSRLFYVSSMPLCMIVAFTAACLPASRTIFAGATAAVFFICGQWLYLEHTNLQPWIEAGKRMAAMREFVKTTAASCAPSEKILLANLPSDYKGAGVIGRPQYLATMLQPPLTNEDYSARVETCEVPIPRSNETVFPQQFAAKLAECTRAFVFDENAGAFVPFLPARGLAELPPTTTAPPDPKGTRWVNIKPLNPLRVQCIKVKFSAPIKLTDPITLTWRTPDQLWWKCNVPPAMVNGNEAFFVPARLRVWTFAKSINMLGIDGSANNEVVSVQSVPLSSLEPSIQSVGSTVSYDGTGIAGCKFIRVCLSKPGRSFSDLAFTGAPPANLVSDTKELSGNSGSIDFAEALGEGKVVRTVCVIALDEHHEPIGVASEVVALRK